MVVEDPLTGFLRIVRTGWILTALGTTGYSEFPAYSQIL